MGRNKSSERKTSNRLQVAEARKAELEAQALEDEMNRPWYRDRDFVKFIVAGMVCAGLLGAWAVSYLEPILTVRQELAVLELKKRELQTEIAALKNERIHMLLHVQFEAWQAALAEVSAEDHDVGNHLAKAKEFITLANFVLANYDGGIDGVVDALGKMEDLLKRGDNRDFPEITAPSRRLHITAPRFGGRSPFV